MHIQCQPYTRSFVKETTAHQLSVHILGGQTETLREDGTRIRTVGKARPWVLDQIPTSVDWRPNNSVRRI